MGWHNPETLVLDDHVEERGGLKTRITVTGVVVDPLSSQ
jgi:hypothetical protein